METIKVHIIFLFHCMFVRTYSQSTYGITSAKITMSPPTYVETSGTVTCDTVSPHLTTITKFNSGTQVSISAITCQNEIGYPICSNGVCDASTTASLRNTFTNMVKYSASVSRQIGRSGFSVETYELVTPIELCMQDGCALISFTAVVKIYGILKGVMCLGAHIESLSNSGYTIGIRLSNCEGVTNLSTVDLAQATMRVNSYTSIKIYMPGGQTIQVGNNEGAYIVLENEYAYSK